jgi:hypothetical protein
MNNLERYVTNRQIQVLSSEVTKALDRMKAAAGNAAIAFAKIKKQIEYSRNIT